MSLVEVLVVAGISAGLFSAIAVLLAGVLRAGAGNTEAVVWQQTWLRLADSWRDDVRRVREVSVEEWTDTQKRKRLIARMGEVEYIAAAPGEIVRIVRAAGEPTAHESFRLRPDERAMFVVDEDDGAATLRIEVDLDEAHAGSRQMEIVAVIGLDLRYREESP